MPVASSGSESASVTSNGGGGSGSGSSGGGGGGGGEKNIWIAAGEGDLERVRYLVEVQGLLPTVPDQWTYTPLHAAASYGQLEVLRFLLSHPNTPATAVEVTDDDGDTPLFAVEDVRVARVLIEEFGANAKHENNAGDTPAANAEENELNELAAYLRSVTGEEPMYQRDARGGGGAHGDPSWFADEDDVDGEQREGTTSTSPGMDAAIEQRTEALMIRVQEILQRAEARGASSGEELTEAEEEELRRVVGESLFTQIREGWGMATSQTVERDASAAASSEAQQSTELSSATPQAFVANGSSDAGHIEQEQEQEDEDNVIPQPGR